LRSSKLYFSFSLSGWLAAQAIGISMGMGMGICICMYMHAYNLSLVFSPFTHKKQGIKPPVEIKRFSLEIGGFLCHG